MKKADNEEVFDWIDSHLSSEMCQQSTFIRSLTTAAAQSCIGELLMIIYIVRFVVCRSCLLF